MTTTVNHRQVYNEMLADVADLWRQECRQHARRLVEQPDMPDDLVVWHERLIHTARLLEVECLTAMLHARDVEREGVTPWMHGTLAYVRQLVARMGEDMPATRHHADMLLGKANAHLNALSVHMEAEHVF